MKFTYIIIIFIILILIRIIDTPLIFFFEPKHKRTNEKIINAQPIFIKKKKIGVLIIHGTTGSPNDAKELVNYLVSKQITVYVPLLKGHGTNPIELSKATYKDWIKDAEKALLKLKKKVKNVYIAGICTGGEIALLLSTKHKVSGVLSLGTSIFYKADKLQKIIIPLLYLIYPYHIKFHRYMLLERGAYASIPLKSMLELSKLTKELKQSLNKVKAPALIMQSVKDYSINPKSAQYIYDNISSKYKELKWFKTLRAVHVVSADTDKKQLFDVIYKFIKRKK